MPIYCLIKEKRVEIGSSDCDVSAGRRGEDREGMDAPEGDERIPFLEGTALAPTHQRGKRRGEKPETRTDR